MRITKKFKNNKINMAKIIHYRKNCIGCNSCVEHACEHWKISNKDGKSDLQGAQEKGEGIFVKEINQIDVEANKQAANDCPVNIIKVIED